MKKYIFIIFLLLVALSTNAFGQSVEARVETLEMKILDLERRIMELEKALQLATSNSELAPLELEDWESRADWRALEQGMTKDVVRSLLGEPLQITQYTSFTVWLYKGLGKVEFDKSGRVQQWSEPWDF